MSSTLPSEPVSLAQRLWTADDVATMLGLSTSGVYELARRGVLPKIQIGRCVRFAQADVENCLGGLRQ